MRERITKKDIKRKLNWTNKLLGNVDPKTGEVVDEWLKDENGELLRDEVTGNLLTNKSVYILDSSCGGFAIETMGGRRIIDRGTAREVYWQLISFNDGLEIGLKIKKG